MQPQKVEPVKTFTYAEKDAIQRLEAYFKPRADEQRAENQNQNPSTHPQAETSGEQNKTSRN